MTVTRSLVFSKCSTRPRNSRCARPLYACRTLRDVIQCSRFESARPSRSAPRRRTRYGHIMRYSGRAIVRRPHVSSDCIYHGATRQCVLNGFLVHIHRTLTGIHGGRIRIQFHLLLLRYPREKETTTRRVVVHWASARSDHSLWMGKGRCRSMFWPAISLTAYCRP